MKGRRRVHESREQIVERSRDVRRGNEGKGLVGRFVSVGEFRKRVSGSIVGVSLSSESFLRAFAEEGLCCRRGCRASRCCAVIDEAL